MRRKRIPERVYVVADEDVGSEDEDVWTISTKPNAGGWETDSGYPGYGLPKWLAEFYARAINDYISRGGE